MMQTVQLSIADGAYADGGTRSLVPQLRMACRIGRPSGSGAARRIWFSTNSHSLGCPSPYPIRRRIVVICRPDPQLLAQAWEAGIVSVVSQEDSLSTVLLAIMAAALRVAKVHSGCHVTSGISPTARFRLCANSPTKSDFRI